MRDAFHRSDLSSSRLVAIAAVLYVLLVVATGFYFNLSLTPDRVSVLLLILALATGRVRAFLKDWSLFLVVILAWQVLQGMSGRLSHLRPHVTEMIDLDRTMFFGQVPTLWLQDHLYHPGHLTWYDIAATLMYEMHFILPLAVAFALWLRNRSVYFEFMLSFFAVALAGFATYLLFPAAPPWIAARWHYLPHVYRILNRGMYLTQGQVSFSTLYHWLWAHGGWDLFGAIPSEHAALPFLCFLYARKCWRRAGWLLLTYSLCVGTAVVYLGEHYVTDVLVGFLYAGLGYLLVQSLIRRKRSKWLAENRPLMLVGSVAPEDQ